MKKLLTIVGVSILAFSLVLGLALPAQATPDMAKRRAEDFPGKIVKGKVLSVDAANQQFVIKSGEDEIIIKVDKNTKYYKIGVPGRIVSLTRRWMKGKNQNGDMPDFKPPKLKWLKPFGEEAEFNDIEKGDKVVVHAVPLAEENSYLAKRVLITKVTTYASVSGNITAVSPESKTITIAPDEDKPPVTLHYNESTVFILKGIIQVVPGQYARAIYDSDNMLAKMVTVYQKVAKPTD